MTKVLVTAKDGQLGQCFKNIAMNNPEIDFIFKSTSDLNITNKSQIESVFNNIDHLDYCINCAAYTKVDKAEEEVGVSNNVNYLGAQNLALVCKEQKVTLIHISTDFVFNGKSTQPYSEEDITSPLNVYGITKLKGEQAIKNVLQNYFIIRTSWLFSEYGNNFLKTMLKLSKTRNEISVVNDQIGCPTYAKDLAEMILSLISTKNTSYGIYNYCNAGIASWYDFSNEIFRLSKSSIKLNGIDTKHYPTIAKRPKYSVLDTSKIKKTLGIEIHSWKDSLAKAYSNIVKGT